MNVYQVVAALCMLTGMAGAFSFSSPENAVAESFFQLLKREKIRRQTYHSLDDARRDVFEYIEMFYKPKRKHTNNGMLSPVDFENGQRKMKQEGV